MLPKFLGLETVFYIYDFLSDRNFSDSAPFGDALMSIRIEAWCHFWRGKDQNTVLRTVTFSGYSMGSR